MRCDREHSGNQYHDRRKGHAYHRLDTRPGSNWLSKATVSYSAHDCTTQLSTSQTGVRFLGLATAVVTTLGPFEGAKTLGVMLKNSKAKGTDRLCAN